MKLHCHLFTVSKCFDDNGHNNKNDDNNSSSINKDDLNNKIDRNIR